MISSFISKYKDTFFNLNLTLLIEPHDAIGLNPAIGRTKALLLLMGIPADEIAKLEKARMQIGLKFRGE